ncbi:MAG: tetratricopeptide repeat protein [Candidatus Eremiobacterota bacterium]
MEPVLQALERLYAEVDARLPSEPGNPCGQCYACCTARGLTRHRVSELEMELIACRVGPVAAREFRRYLERERRPDGGLVHEVCPNYRQGCGLYAQRPLSCRLYGHYSVEGTRLVDGCVFVGRDRLFVRSDYYRIVPGAAGLRRLERSFALKVGRAPAPPEERLEDPSVGLNLEDPLDRSLLLQVQGRFREALEALEGEASAEADYARGALWCMLDRPDLALECLLRAAQELPENPEVAYMVGSQYLVTNRPQEGIPWLERAVELDAGHGLAWGFLGYGWLQRGDGERARGCFQEAVRLQPDNQAFRARLEAMR